MSTDRIDRDNIFLQNVPPELVIGADPAEALLLREYGAVFLARGVTPPDKIVFKDESDVVRFQSRLQVGRRLIGGHELELQSRAMDHLLAAIEKVSEKHLTITPRGADSARRSYGETIDLWRSRVEPALIHWVEKGRMTQEETDAIRSLSPYKQVPEVFALEAEGIYFAKDLSKSIIYSVAPPGSSQHLSLLAFDITEFNNAEVRDILAKHFWYQTVVSDLPHFTFLGVEVDELPGLGLKKVTNTGREFWVPDI